METPAAAIPFKNIHERLILARVESYDYLKDDNGEEILDEQGNRIPTGLLNVLFLEREGSREKVPYCVPFAGNTGFSGGLPEVGTTCVIGWMAANMPMILGFLSFGLHNVITKRETVPNLTEGEVFLQASIKDVDVNSEQDFYRGASMWLDRYGRIRFAAEGYEYVCGNLLADEFTPGVSGADDPLTGQPVFLRERFPNGTERRIDNLGSGAFTYGGSLYERVAKDYDGEVAGVFALTARSGMLIQDERNNHLSIQDGNVELHSTSGTLSLFALGTMTQETNGSHELRTTEHQFVAIGKTRQETVGGTTEQTFGDSVTVDVQTGDFLLNVLTGSYELAALQGITLETVAPLAPLKLGSQSAAAPVPLGDVLTNALNSLITILTTAPLGLSGVGPVTLNPTLVAQLATWRAQYLTTPATNIVSQKVFTERA